MAREAEEATEMTETTESGTTAKTPLDPRELTLGDISTLSKLAKGSAKFLDTLKGKPGLPPQAQHDLGVAAGRRWDLVFKLMRVRRFLRAREAAEVMPGQQVKIEHRLVRTITSGCREERRVFGRSQEIEHVEFLFGEHAPYGPRDVSWAIETYEVTETLLTKRVMTPEEVGTAVTAEAAKLHAMQAEGVYVEEQDDQAQA